MEDNKNKKSIFIILTKENRLLKSKYNIEEVNNYLGYAANITTILKDNNPNKLYTSLRSGKKYKVVTADFYSKVEGLQYLYNTVYENNTETTREQIAEKYGIGENDIRSFLSVGDFTYCGSKHSKVKIKDIPEKHNIYIIKCYGSNMNLVKVGYSNNIKSRLITYYYHNPLLEIVFTTHIENAIEFEKEFHRTNTSYIMNEWYEEDKLLEIMDTLNVATEIRIK